MNKVVGNTGTFALMPLILIAIVGCLLFSADPIFAAGQNEGSAIRIGGTGGAMATMAELGKAFQKKHPKTKIIILPSLGSSGGIKAVLSGAIDLGVSSRPLKESEFRQGATSLAYAKTPFIFVTTHTIRGIKLTLRDIAAIYEGKISKWPDGTQMRLVLRPVNESDTTILKGLSVEMNEAVRKAQAREGMIKAATDTDNLNTLLKTPGSIGASSLAQIVSENKAINILPVDGVAPGLTTLADGTYPFEKTFFLVTSGKPAPAAKQFIEFINSAEGRAVLTKTGNLALGQRK